MGGQLRRREVDRSETPRTVKKVNNSMEGRKCIRHDTQMEREHKREGRYKQSGSRSLVGVVEGIPVCERRVSEEGEVTLGCECDGGGNRRVSRGVSLSASRHLVRVFFMAILYLNPAGAYLLEKAGIPTQAWLVSLVLIAISIGISLIRRWLQKGLAVEGRNGEESSFKTAMKRLFALMLMLMGGCVAVSEGARVVESLLVKYSDEAQFGRYDKEISYGSWPGSQRDFEAFLVGDGVAEAIIGVIRGLIIFVGGAGMQLKQTGYKRSWKRKVFFTAGCVLLPLIAVTCIAIKTHEMDDKESKFGTLSDQQIFDEYNMIIGRHQEYDLNGTVNTDITEVVTLKMWNREVSDYMDSDMPLLSCLGKTSENDNFNYKKAPAFRLYDFFGDRLWDVECSIMHMLYSSEVYETTCAQHPRVCKERNEYGNYVTNFKYVRKYGADEYSIMPLLVLLLFLTGMEFMITANWVLSCESSCCHGKQGQWSVWILVSVVSVGAGIASLVMFANGNFQPPSKIRIGGVMARLGVYDFGWQKIVAFLITLIFDVASVLGAVDDVTAEAADFGVNVADAVGV